jgi:hypothetical protein
MPAKSKRSAARAVKREAPDPDDLQSENDAQRSGEDAVNDSASDAKPQLESDEVPRKRRKTAKTKPHKPNNHPKSTGNPKGSKAWSGAEFQALFTAALAGPAARTRTGFDGAVPGRTGQQCYSAWRWVLAGCADGSNILCPAILKFARQRGEGE